ncbi:Sensor protein KdpD [compost metagenome]
MKPIKSICILCKPYVSISFFIVIIIVAMRAFGNVVEPHIVALFFILPVLLATVFWGICPAIFAATMGGLTFSFFFISPIPTFSITDLRGWLPLGVYLLVATIAANLSFRMLWQHKS